MNILSSILQMPNLRGWRQVASSRFTTQVVFGFVLPSLPSSRAKSDPELISSGPKFGLSEPGFNHLMFRHSCLTNPPPLLSESLAAFWCVKPPHCSASHIFTMQLLLQSAGYQLHSQRTRLTQTPPNKTQMLVHERLSPSRTPILAS